jgi:hypothetical protein
VYNAATGQREIEPYQAEITGVLPIGAPAFITDEQSRRCTSPGK